MSWAAEEALRIDLGGGVERYHAVFCDPPYGISFMSKAWDDHGGPEAFQQQAKIWGEALLPLLRPGALVFMFAGTRMWHRLTCGMEDAGFKLWDTMMWLYGQGFPKAQDIAKMVGGQVTGLRADAAKLNKSIQEAGTGWVTSTRDPNTYGGDWAGYKTPQLKPAWEPILCFQAPKGGEKYANLALKYGSGCLNVDESRIGYVSDWDAKHQADICRGQENATNGVFFGGKGRSLASTNSPQGRYPANIVFDEESAAMLDEQTGILTSGKSKPEYRKNAKNNIYGQYKNEDMPINVIGDSGGASRFFYCAKAARSEREAGLELLEDIDYGHSPRTGAPCVGNKCCPLGTASNANVKSPSACTTNRRTRTRP